MKRQAIFFPCVGMFVNANQPRARVKVVLNVLMSHMVDFVSCATDVLNLCTTDVQGIQM